MSAAVGIEPQPFNSELNALPLRYTQVQKADFPNQPILKLITFFAIPENRCEDSW